MALRTKKFAAATAVAAALSLLATPVGARDYYGRHHHHDGVDAGDVVAGVVLLGAIAAIAGAADRHNNGQVRERNPDYDYNYPEPAPDGDRNVDPNTGYAYPGAKPEYGNGYGYGSRGIDRAVDMCVDQVERGDNRVATVDSVARSGEGWQVSGNTDGGLGYSCTIGDDGSIGDVFVGGAYQQTQDGQYGDDYYANARANQDGAGDHYSNLKQ